MIPPAQSFSRYAKAAMLDAACRAQGDAWLSGRESRELELWRNPARRQAWRRGRMLAKQLVARQLNAEHLEIHKSNRAAPLATIEILSRDAQGRVNRPQVWHNGAQLSWSLSISHTARGVLAALDLEVGRRVGVDMTPRAELPAALSNTWFSRAEQAWLAASGSADIGCFVWAAKEALYKAWNQDESFDPRAYEVLPHGEHRYRGVPLPGVRLRSWDVDGHVAVLATIGNG